MDLAFAVYFEYRRQPQLVPSLLHETAIVAAKKTKSIVIGNITISVCPIKDDNWTTTRCASCCLADTMFRPVAGPREDRAPIVAERFGENGRTIVVEISTNDAIREISLAGAVELVRRGVSKQVLPRIPTPLAVWKISPCRRGK